MIETKVTLAFGKDHRFELDDESKSLLEPMILQYRKILLEDHDAHPYEGDEYSEEDRKLAGMRVDFVDDYAPDFGHVTLDYYTCNVEELRAGRGDLTFIWPEGFFEYLLNLYESKINEEK